MNDEPVVEFLRARGRAEPPLDLVPAVLDALDTVPQRRPSWFTAFVPAAAAVAVAAAIAAVAFVVSENPNVGPGPIGSDSPEPTATERHTDPTASPTPSSSEPAPMGGDLLQRGNIVDLEIRSVEGVTGQITLRREMDVGGYPLVPDPSTDAHFFVEVRVTYDLERAPETATWGALDWRVEAPDGSTAVELLQSFPMPGGRNYLGNWPGATVPEPRYDGWLIYAVPRELASSPLELVYQPPGVSDEARIPLREPGEAPPPVAAQWPRPAPVYIEQPGLPFTVFESAEADALFAEPDTCTNPVAGYTVTYPDSWYTNTAVGSVPACSWFSATFYELTEDGSRPPEIAMEIGVFSGNVGTIWVDLYSEDVVLDGFGARRYETGGTKDVNMPTDHFTYSYLAYLDGELDGRKLWAFTGVDYGGSYDLNRAVLDRIMASLRWTDGER